MVSMSSGLISPMPSPPSLPPQPPATSVVAQLLLTKGMPFNTYSGWLLPVILVMPRITTLLAPFGPVATPLTFTPAILPSKLFTKLFSRASVIVPPLTSVTEQPIALFSFEIPNAVTTTSFNCSLTNSSFISSTVWLPTATSRVLQPTFVKTSIDLLFAAIAKAPVLLVDTLVLVPFKVTVTPFKGTLVSISVTVPETSFAAGFCADARLTANTRNIAVRQIFLIIRKSLLK